MSDLRVRLLNETFSIHKLPPSRPIPPTVLGSPIFFVGRTKDELSIVCRADIPVSHAKTEENWACFMVEGPLDFNIIGVIARLSAVLAHAEVSIFSFSTFDTDYILVRQGDLLVAEKALKTAGFKL